MRQSITSRVFLSSSGSALLRQKARPLSAEMATLDEQKKCILPFLQARQVIWQASAPLPHAS